MHHSGLRRVYRPVGTWPAHRLRWRVSKRAGAVAEL